MDADGFVQAYYDAIDDGDYDTLGDLLATEFEHVRPDRTLSGREAFVSFMRDDRPQTDTAHVLNAVYEGRDGVAARGRLLDADGEIFAFVDVFDLSNGAIQGLATYTSPASSTAGNTDSS
jgi:ketosteroid isomerase-like protein